MSVDAGTPTPTPSAGAQTASGPSPDATTPPLLTPEEVAARADAMEESDELRRRRRHRRRRTVADLPTKQKRFRLILLGLVIFALILAATGKELRTLLSGPVGTVTHALPLQQIKRFMRPELLLLLGAVFVMLVLVFPDLEEKIMVVLGFRKPARRGGSRHRSGSNRK